MHIKRKTIPDFWPIPRTGTKYMAVPSHNPYNSVSLMMILRDILKIAKTRKEIKKLLNEKKILVNGKIVKETNYPITLFDSIAMPSIKKYYKADLENRRMILRDVSDKESHTRIYKVIGKSILPGKKVQLNLSNGRNIISSEKISVGNFVIMNNTENKILKVVPLKENLEVLVIKGKHTGKRGKVKEIIKEGENTIAKIASKHEEIKANVNNLFAIE